MSTPNYISDEQMQMTLELVGASFAELDLKFAISAASRSVETYTGRRFYADPDTSGTRFYTPTSGHCLLIDDVISVATFATDNDGNGVWETVWTQNADYVLGPYNAAEAGWPYTEVQIHPASGQRWYAWPRSVKITGQFGWPSVPDPVVESTTILASRFLQRARSAPFGIVSAGLDVPGMRIPKMDPDVGMMLEPYVRGGGVLVA